MWRLKPGPAGGLSNSGSPPAAKRWKTCSLSLPETAPRRWSLPAASWWWHWCWRRWCSHCPQRQQLQAAVATGWLFSLPCKHTVNKLYYVSFQWMWGNQSEAIGLQNDTVPPRLFVLHTWCRQIQPRVSTTCLPMSWPRRTGLLNRRKRSGFLWFGSSASPQSNRTSSVQPNRAGGYHPYSASEGGRGYISLFTLTT